MLKKIILIFFFLFSLIKPLFASIEEKIINNLIKTENLTFDFKQTIGEKTEEGHCIIEYPKKIFCLYKNRNKKTMVSNGRSLVIKNNNEINIFFDKKTLNLIGWQTEDIYQNLVVTYIYKIQYNQKIDKNIFKLPKNN